MNQGATSFFPSRHQQGHLTFSHPSSTVGWHSPRGGGRKLQNTKPNAGLRNLPKGQAVCRHCRIPLYLNRSLPKPGLFQEARAND